MSHETLIKFGGLGGSGETGPTGATGQTGATGADGLSCKRYLVTSTTESATVLYNSCDCSGCECGCECIMLEYATEAEPGTTYIQTLTIDGTLNGKPRYIWYLPEVTGSFTNPLAEVVWNSSLSLWEFKFISTGSIRGTIDNPIRPVAEGAYTWAGLGEVLDSFITTCECIKFYSYEAGGGENGVYPWIAKTEGIINGEPYYIYYLTTTSVTFPTYYIIWNSTLSRWEALGVDVNGLPNYSDVKSYISNPTRPVEESTYTWSEGNGIVLSEAAECNAYSVLELTCPTTCPYTFSGSNNSANTLDQYLGLGGDITFTFTATTGSIAIGIADGLTSVYTGSTSTTVAVTLSPTSTVWQQITIQIAELTNADWSYTVSCPTDLLAPGTFIDKLAPSAGVGYPTYWNYFTLNSTGTTSFSYNAVTVPDRFMVYTYNPDGSPSGQENLVIDTGWVGAAQYNFGGGSRSTFNTNLTGEIDPATGVDYPYVTADLPWPSYIASDGFPFVTQPAGGSATYNHLSTYNPYAVAKVYALPASTTGWSLQLNEPANPVELDNCSAIINSTSCPEVITGDAVVQCLGLAFGEIGATGPTGAAGAPGSSSSYFPYKAKTTSTSGDPLVPYITWNNPVQASATQLFIHHIDVNGIDIDIFLALLGAGSSIIIQDATLSSNYQKWDVTGSVTQTSTFTTVPVSLDISTTTFTNNQDIIIALITPGPAGPTGPTGPTGLSGGWQSIGTASGTTFNAAANQFVLVSNAACIVTLPVVASLTRVCVKLTVAPTSSISVKTNGGTGNIDGVPGSTGIPLYNQYDALVFVCDGTNWWIEA